MNQQKPPMLVPALMGGLFLGITSALPLVNLINCACCVLVIGGGIIAAFVYLRDYPRSLPPVTYGEGAILGVFTGLLGALIWTAVDIPLSLFKLQIGANMADLSELQDVLSDPNIPPALREGVLSLFAGGALTLGMIIFSLFVNLLVSILFAMIGAIIGIALFQKRPPAYVPPSARPSGPPPSELGPGSGTPPPGSMPPPPSEA